MLCWQNLGEAEMAVSVYMYMRLRGYPAAQISILSPYNGQVALLRDVVERRCAQHPAFGRPHKVRSLTPGFWLRAAARCLRDADGCAWQSSLRCHWLLLQVATVDKYQGQQNEYVLLSLTRTRAVGHIRDVRRLVVAMSRARLGLYVLGRAALFANCYELQPTFSQLLSRPTQLLLHPTETFAVWALPITSMETLAAWLPVSIMTEADGAFPCIFSGTCRHALVKRSQ